MGFKMMICQKWIERNQTWFLPLTLITYATLVFWSILAKLGVYGTGDIGNYIATGLMWTNDILSFSDSFRPNRGFAILCGFIVSVVNDYNSLPVVACLVFPSFLIAIYYFFKTFEQLSDARTAYWVSFLVVALPTVNLSVRYALPEIPLLAVYAFSLYLTVSGRSPFFIGVILGLSFWLRSQVLMFIPLWPFLFKESKNPRSFMKNGLLLGLGVLPGVLAQYLVDGQIGAGGYAGIATLPLNMSFDQITEQLSRLTEYKVELAIYIIGFGSIGVRRVRTRYWRLWLFATLPMVVLLAVLFVVGATLRPGVFLFMFIPYVFLSYVALENNFSCFATSRKRVWLVPVVVFLGLCSGRAMNVFRYATEPASVGERLRSFPLDHRDLFALLPAGAVILVEGYRAFIWTRINALHADIIVLDCPQGFDFELDRNMYSNMALCGKLTNSSTKDSFQSTVELFESNPDLSVDALAVWRQGDPRQINFPGEFTDSAGKVYRILGQRKAINQAFALYLLDK